MIIKRTTIGYRLFCLLPRYIGSCTAVRVGKNYTDYVRVTLRK